MIVTPARANAQAASLNAQHAIEISRYVQLPTRFALYPMNSTYRTKGVQHDQDLQMQPVHLRPQLQMRRQPQGVQLQPIVQVRNELRLRELIAARRSASSPPPTAMPTLASTV